MTTFIAAYDTEDKTCLDGVRTIVAMHEKYQIPATFFMVAGLLDEQGAAYRELLAGNPLFEIASHTYTHMLLRDSRLCGKAGPEEEHHREVVGSKNRLEDFFGQPVVGFRTPVSFSDGLQGSPGILALCKEAGYRYSSSQAWGPQESLPALIVEAYTYARQGYPELLEIPPCGWHENLLKGHNNIDPQPFQLFPHPMPEAIMTRYLETPEEEFEYGRIFVDKAVDMGVGHVNLIWHPWSLHRFDPQMKMLDLLFTYVQDKNMTCKTFQQHAEALSTNANQAAVADTH